MGVCVSGKVETPPMVEGKYFDFATSWTDTPKAVLGKQYREHAVERDGKMYHDYQGVEFEVIGGNFKTFGSEFINQVPSNSSNRS